MSTPALAQFPGAVFLKTPRGPTGDPIADVGQQVVSSITILNVDGFNDSFLITNVFDVVHHFDGDEISPNLLETVLHTNRLILHAAGSGFPDYFVTFTYTNTVRPGDTNLPGRLLTDDANAGLVDLHDLSGGITLGFSLTVPGQINIPAPPPPPSTNTNYCVIRAVSSLIYNHGGSDHAVWLPGISTNLIFFPQPGSFTPNSDGTATLTGDIRSLTNLETGFHVDVHLSGYTTTPPPGSPKKDLDPNAYIENGGPVDPSTWVYYTEFHGALTGFGLYSNAVLNITNTGPAFQVGVGANQKNVNFGASGWFNWTTIQQPAHGSFPATGRGDFNVDFIVCPVNTLGDFVWQDLNGNGIQDSGEPGVPNVEVRLTDCSSKTPTLAVTHTDANGLYFFDNLIPTNYRVRVTLPTSFTLTTLNAGGNDDLDNDFGANGLSPCTTVTTNSIITNVDAGVVMFCPACSIRYPFSSTNSRTSLAFEEDSMIKAFSASPLGPADTIKVWYNDETAMLLGVRQVIVKTSAGSTTNDFGSIDVIPGGAMNPPVGATDLTGDFAGTDPSGRPVFPALFITDITTDGASLAGDWQFGGMAVPPHAVFGTWKFAVRTVDQTKNPPVVKLVGDPDPAKNHWNLTGGDPVPSAGLKDEGFGTELRWNVGDLGLTPGHTYRAQFMVHDGDPQSGVEAGQNCVTLCIPGSFPVQPRVIKLVTLPSGQKSMTIIKGELGRTYSIESSQDMVQWRSIATVINSNNTLQFSDPNQSVRTFYRIKMMP